MIPAQSPPPSGATANEGAKALRALIARCQRRAWLRLFVRYGAAGCTIALLITSGLWYLSPATAASVLWPLAAAGVVAAASVIAASWRCPSTRTVAAALDSRLGLDDSVVAALQVHGGNSLLAPLIVSHAVSRAGAASPGDVFPIDLRIPAAAIGAGLFVLVLTALTMAPVTAGSTTNAGSRLAGDSSAAHESPPLDAKNGSEDAPRAERIDADAKDARVADESGRPASLARADRVPAAGAASIDRPEVEAGDATTTRAASAAGSAGESRERTGEAGAPGGRLAATRASAGADGTASGSATDSGHGRDEGVGRGSGGFAVGQGPGSGGVRGGGLLAAGGSDGPAPGSTRRGLPPSGQDRRDREAAAASDAVPPELREYVRRYFGAITSASERP